MGWILIGAYLANHFFGSSKKKVDTTNPTPRVYTPSVYSFELEAQKPTSEPETRKVPLTFSQENKVRYVVNTVSKPDDWFVKLYTSLGHGDEDRKPLFIDEIEAAIKFLQDTNNDPEQIELLQASIPRLTALWVGSREANRQYVADRAALPEGRRIFDLYIDKGYESAKAYIESLPTESQEVAMRILAYCELVY